MIDVEKGIENCGSEEIYNEVISMFCKDGRKRVKNLQKSLEDHYTQCFLVGNTFFEKRGSYSRCYGSCRVCCQSQQAM